MGTVNAPTIFNVALNFSFFWDGRARSLEQQMDGPIHDINEMGSSWPIITDRLNARDDYRSEFLAIYKSRASEFTIKDAIAAYERSLITLNAPFDRYLRGDRDALTEQQSYGYTLFKNFGCVACHQGRGVGGNMFQVLGVVHSYFDERGNITKADYGRFNVTGDERDRFRFKVPSLRNVALTAPYFHDGSAATLDDAVRTMARYQLGRTLSNEDLAAIVAFLNSLTGETPDP
jgi:cytochrome c peroxidase